MRGACESFDLQSVEALVTSIGIVAAESMAADESRAYRRSFRTERLDGVHASGTSRRKPVRERNGGDRLNISDRQFMCVKWHRQACRQAFEHLIMITWR